MKKQNIKLAATLFIILFSLRGTNAQSFTEGLHIGAKFGTSKLFGETSSDISGRINEFEDSFGPAYDIEIARYLAGHWELSLEIGASTLKGETDDPRFSAVGIHYSMPDPLTAPVEYQNILYAQKISFSYYLRDLNRQRDGLYLNPYLRVGGGHLLYNSKLKYVDAPDDDLIFGKGKGNYNGNRMTTGVFFAGGGVKASITENISLLASANFNYVNSDFLDAVYNYTPMGERMKLSGLYSEFKFGVFYSFGKGGASKKSSGKNKSGNKGGGRSRATNGHLPFAR